MSWLFSQALVAEYSAGNCSVGEQSARLNVTDMPQAYCVPDKMMAFSRLSRFGMTSAPLTADRGEELLTWFLAAIHVRQTVTLPVMVPTLRAWEINLSALLKKSVRGSFSEKTHSLFDVMHPGQPEDSVMPWRILGLQPLSSSSGHVVWGGITERCAHGSLAYRSPNARDWKGVSAKSWRERSSGDKTPTLPDQIGGVPHPEFVEELMMWPPGWTDLKPLGMDKYQEWLQEHSYQ